MKKLFIGLIAGLLLFGGVASPATAQSYTGSWYNEAQNGMGMPCVHQGQIVFCTWFIYDGSGKGIFLISSGKLQKDAGGKDFYSADLLRAWGTPPQTFDKAKTKVAAAGTMSMLFETEYSATYTYSYTNEDGSKQAGTLQMYPYQFGCAPPAVWNGKFCVAPKGVWVVGANQLSPGCTSWYQDCWKEPTKLIATSATMTGVSSRPIMLGFFRDVNGLWGYSPMFADEGLPVFTTPTWGTGISGSTTQGIDQMKGTDYGFLAQATNGLCYEIRWFPPTTQTGVGSSVWANIPVTCPQ